MGKKNIEKKKQVLRELQKHEGGITIRKLATLIKSNPKTVGKWLHRLEYEEQAESMQFGSAYVFYPIKEVKTRKNEK